MGNWAKKTIVRPPSVANDHAILPIAFRLYPPEDWAEDSGRRSKAGVPADIVFKTKPQIALDQIRAAQADGVPDGCRITPN